MTGWRNIFLHEATLQASRVIMGMLVSRISPYNQDQKSHGIVIGAPRLFRLVVESMTAFGKGGGG